MSVGTERQPPQTRATGDAAGPIRNAIGHRTATALSARYHLSVVRKSDGNSDLLGYSDSATSAWRRARGARDPSQTELTRKPRGIPLMTYLDRGVTTPMSARAARP